MQNSDKTFNKRLVNHNALRAILLPSIVASHIDVSKARLLSNLVHAFRENLGEAKVLNASLLCYYLCAYRRETRTTAEAPQIKAQIPSHW